MNRIRELRERLGLSQAALAAELGMTQGNVSFYERGQTVLPQVAGQLIAVAKAHGLDIGYDHVYGALPLPNAAAGGVVHELDVVDAEPAAVDPAGA